MREPGSGIRDYVNRHFAQQGLQLRTRMELGSNEAIKHSVVGGLGIAVASLHTMTLDAVNSGVRILDVESFPIMRQWYIVYPKGRELSLVARTFLDFSVDAELDFHGRMEKLCPGVSKQVQQVNSEDVYTNILESA